MRFITLALFAVACSKASKPVPADRPLALFWGDTDTANKAQLPKDFTVPDEHQCAADPTRAYIAELFFHGLGDVQVTEHWAPVVPGPTQRRTLNQPEFWLAGTVQQMNVSGDDVLGDHPFGTDLNLDVHPDDAYTFLPFNRGGSDTSIHTELEQRIVPRAALGFSPQPGDRVLQRGAWVLDCGHPPYDAEIHPPTFNGYARAADAKTTIAAVFVAPYRSSLLFNPNPALASDFANTARFGNFQTKPFSQSLVDAVLHAAANDDDRLTTHALMIGNRFDRLDWLICAPLPRPAGAALDASWRLTARTGVTLKATPDEKSGCVRFESTMTADYTPMALAHEDADWAWDDLSASASSQLGQPLDVRQEIIKLLGGNAANLKALQPDHPPRVDAYPALQPRAGADQDAPTAIDLNADDQPFPFYGRVRVGWR